MPVQLVPYDPAWPEQFALHRLEFEQALDPWLSDGVHHIGSTSIPGCAAKPILDLMAGVRHLDPAAAVPLTSLGYVQGEHRPSEALWFSRDGSLSRDGSFSTPGSALHLTQPGSDLWRERLAFRDALRADDRLRDEYARLKLQLADNDLRGYTDAKRPFVAEVLASKGIDLARR
ncbi:MAG: GrpB family protein [Mycobacteriales bacterium]